MRISKKYQDFDAFILTFSVYVQSNWQRLGIAENDNQQLQVNFGRWTNAYYDYIDVTKQNTRTILEIADIYNQTYAMVRKIQRFIIAADSGPTSLRLLIVGAITSSRSCMHWLSCCKIPVIRGFKLLVIKFTIKVI